MKILTMLVLIMGICSFCNASDLDTIREQYELILELSNQLIDANEVLKSELDSLAEAGIVLTSEKLPAKDYKVYTSTDGKIWMIPIAWPDPPAPPISTTLDPLPEPEPEPDPIPPTPSPDLID